MIENSRPRMIDLRPVRQDNILVTHPDGHIDQAHADDFLVAFRAAIDCCTEEKTALLIDFSAVDYISSVGLRVLMITAREARAASIPLAMAALRPLVREILQISRFDMVVKLWPTTDEATATLRDAMATRDIATHD